MNTSDFYGQYDYKGFIIWSSAEKEWIAEPEWSDEAIENLKYKGLERHRTITLAKKWVREIGVHLKEEDYLNKKEYQKEDEHAGHDLVELKHGEKIIVECMTCDCTISN